MSSDVKTQKTSRFLDPWPYVAIASTCLILLAMFFGGAMGKTLLSKAALVQEDEIFKLEPIQLKSEPIGALRIDVTANIPANRWVTYEIQIRDAQDKILASGIKQAWFESGTWSEEGESGTWSEDDLKGGLDVRALQNEPVTIALQVLEYSDTSGREIKEPVTLLTTVQTGVIDFRYLWTGFFGTLAVSLLALIGTTWSGTKAVKQSRNDSDVSGRAIVGGNNRLVHVAIHIKADRNSPAFLIAELIVRDRSGDEISRSQHSVRMTYNKNDKGVIEGANGSVGFYLIFKVRSSYGFHVEVNPDSSVDRTTLVIRDGVRTLTPVNVTELQPVD